MTTPSKLAPSLNEALEHHQKGDISKAITLYQALLSSSPSVPALLGLLATGMAQTKKLNHALSWFERSFQLDPFNEATLSNYIQALQDAKAPDRSIPLCHWGIASWPERVQHYLSAGQAHLLLGQHNRSLVFYSRVLKISPMEPAIIALVAERLFAMNEKEAALSLAHKAIALDPGQEGFYSLEGRIQKILGAIQKNQRAFERSSCLSGNPHATQINQALHYLTSGQFLLARRAFEALLILDPQISLVLEGLADTLSALGLNSAALKSLESGLNLNPKEISLHIKLATACVKMDALERGGDLFRRSILLYPMAIEGYVGLAITQVRLDDPSKALSTLDHALIICPDSGAALLCRGDALMKLARNEDALSAYESALKEGTESPEALMAKAQCQQALGLYDVALQSYAAALELDPQSTALFINRGNLFLELKQYTKALDDYQCAERQGGESLAIAINRANALFGLGRLTEALQGYTRASELDPKGIEGPTGQAAVHQKLRRYKDALSAHETVYRLSHQAPSTLGSLIYCSMKCWDRDRLKRYLEVAVGAINQHQDIGNPFPLLTCLDAPEMHHHVAIQHANPERKTVGKSSGGRIHKKTDNRISLGYFSSDLTLEHPVGINLLPLLQAHDKDQFKLVAFTSSPKPSQEILGHFDEVFEMGHTGDLDVARHAQKMHLDLAIDLNGYTEGSRTEIFAHRPGRIQINYLGYPGTMGTDFHDFIIADGYVIPETSNRYYSEQVLRLPHFFMPYDLLSGNLSPVKTARQQHGLPSDAFVYCSFNDFHKITQQALNSWIRILQGTQNTVLWIARRGETTEEEVRKVFRSGGIASDRIIFAPRTTEFRDHLARLRLADLMLDTFPYNSHTTACDAVACELPLLTISGQSFASRVSGSLLTDLRTPELITLSWKDYTEKAVTIAEDRNYSNRIHQKFREGKSFLVDSKTYAQGIESLYRLALKHSVTH